MKGALRAKIMADVIAPLLKRDALESLVVDGFEDVEPFLVALALLLRLANRSVLRNISCLHVFSLPFSKPNSSDVCII